MTNYHPFFTFVEITKETLFRQIIQLMIVVANTFHFDDVAYQTTLGVVHK